MLTSHTTEEAGMTETIEGPIIGAGHAAGGLAEPERDRPGVPSALSLTPHELGARGEQAAVRWLLERGWGILTRNWRCDDGEVDIVARDPDRCVALIEVKTRLAVGESPSAGVNYPPELAVDAAKRAKYERLAGIYLAMHPEIELVRFDVIAITVTAPDRAHLRYLRSAFEGGRS